MDRLWTRSFVQMTLATLLLFCGFYLLLPTLPLYIRELGGNDAHVGLATGVFTLAAVFVRPFAGGALDQYGRKPFLLAGLGLFALSMYLYGWVGAIGTLLIVRLLHGVSWAFSTTAAAAAVTDILPPARLGEGMGWYGIAMTLAMALGPMLGVWMQRALTFNSLFPMAAGLSILALLAALFTPLPFQPKGSGRRFSIYDPTLLPISIVVAFLAVAYGSAMTFLPLFAEAIQVNSGAYFLVYAAALTVIRPFAGAFSDRYGEAAVIIPAAATTVLALLVLSTTNGLSGVITAAVLNGVGFGSAQPALQAATLRLARPDRAGVANASFFTAFDLGIAFGSVALGWLAQSLGYRALFVAGAGSVALSLLIFATLVRPSLLRSAAMQQ